METLDVILDEVRHIRQEQSEIRKEIRREIGELTKDNNIQFGKIYRDIDHVRVQSALNTQKSNALTWLVSAGISGAIAGIVAWFTHHFWRT